MRLDVCCRLSEDVGPVGFHNVSGWLLGVVDAFQDGGYAAGSKDIYCYLCKELYDRRIFARVICSLFFHRPGRVNSSRLGLLLFFFFRRTYEISTFIRVVSEGPPKNKKSFPELFSYKAAFVNKDKNLMLTVLRFIYYFPFSRVLYN